MKAQTTETVTNPTTIEMDGIVCFESEENPGTWLYIPGAPQPETVNGRPSLQLYASRESGILQFGARWTLSPEQHAKLRQKIGSLQTSDQIDLQPAPVAVQQCVVEVGGPKGERTQLATSPSSGYPPYAAIFRITLTNEGKSMVVGALNGREGILFVRYQGMARIRVSAHVVLTGDVGRSSEGLRSSSTQSEILAWMEQSLETGVLRLEVAGNPERDLVEAATKNAKAQFAAAVQSKLRGPDAANCQSSKLRIEASSSDFLEREFEREADISEWFPAGSGQDFITVA